MTWEQVQSRFPAEWVLIEAVKAHTNDDQRILDEIAVIHPYGEDSRLAMCEYRDLHRSDPQREMYVVHTSRSALDIQEERLLGI